MAMHKSVAVQHEMLKNPRKTREVAVTTMLSAYDWTAGIKTDPHASLRYFDLETNTSPVYDRIEAAVREVLAWIGIETDEDDTAWYRLLCRPKDAVATYEAVKALTDEQLDKVFTVMLAMTFGQGDVSGLDTEDSLFNRVAADLGVDMREHWTPDMAFLSKRNKPQLIAIAHDCGAAAYTSAISTYKKSELVSVLTRHFEGARDAAEPNEHQQKALAWLPEAMHFPAIDPDAKAPDEGDEAAFAEAAE
jgi:ParB family chromosome partitioning protein